MRTWPAVRPHLWALGLLWLLPALVVAVGYVVLPDHPPDGQCEGIGFGCVLAPNDSLLLLGMIASPFLLLAGFIAIAVIEVVKRRRRGNG